MAARKKSKGRKKKAFKGKKGQKKKYFTQEFPGDGQEELPGGVGRRRAEASAERRGEDGKGKGMAASRWVGWGRPWRCSRLRRNSILESFQLSVFSMFCHVWVLLQAAGDTRGLCTRAAARASRALAK